VIPAGVDPELLEAFLAETSDALAQGEKLLLDLEHRRRDPRALQELLRHLHTLKGAAAAVGLADVASHFHRGESLLQAVNAGQIRVEPARLLDFLFRYLDSVRAVVAALHGSGDGAAVMRAMEGAIENLLRAERAEAEPADGAAADGGAGGGGDEVEALDSDAAILRVPAARIDGLLQRVGELMARRARLDITAGRMRALERRLDAARRRLGAVIDGAQDRGDVSDLARASYEAASETRDATRELGTLVRELGLQLHHLSQTAGTLQRQITRLRLVPLETVFRRLTRAAREVARLEGKQVELRVEGGDVQIDRLIAEALYPPLLHLVRNAVSHGIESAEVRARRGKPATGVVRLSARPRYNRVVLTVADDGGGLAFEAILAKARAQNLIPAGTVPRREQLLALIYRPGFTTEDSVSEVSGRGVGLDVVAREVAALKGTVAATSESEHGTAFQLAVPTTASIEEVALVEVGQQTFALPTEYMRQSLLIDARALEKLRTSRAYSFRGQPIPVLFLAPLVSEAVAAEGAVLTVLHAVDRSMALVVERVRAKEEVVVRPLGRVLEAHPFLSGATLTATGQVIFVVNVARLFDVVSYTSHQAPESEPVERPATPAGPTRGVLLVDDSKSMRKLASHFLAAEQIDAETAVDGIDALEKLAASQFRVVVTDLEMPRLHGYELLAAIKRDPRWAHVPVIVCTSRSSETHQRRARELGADGYIVKPFTKDQLCGEIQRVWK